MSVWLGAFCGLAWVSGYTLLQENVVDEYRGRTFAALTTLSRAVLFLSLALFPALAVLYIDLDGFKRINDEHGHAVGDEVLRSIATRIRASIRDTDLAARLGGDEFAVVLFRADLAAATRLADKLIATLAAPCMIGALRIQLSASIGIAAYPDSAGNAETLSRLADQAMYRAKNEGKRRYAVV